MPAPAMLVRFRRVCGRAAPSCRSLTTVMAEADTQLEVFPEFAEASGLAGVGNHEAALPLFQRIVDVCEASMPGSPMHDAALRQCVAQLAALGRAGDGLQMLWRLIAPSASRSIADAAVHEAALARHHLSVGDVDGAGHVLRIDVGNLEDRRGADNSAALAVVVDAVLVHQASLSSLSGTPADVDDTAAWLKRGEQALASSGALFKSRSDMEARLLANAAAVAHVSSGAYLGYTPPPGAKYGGVELWPCDAALVDVATELYHRALEVPSSNAALSAHIKLNAAELKWATEGAPAAVEDITAILKSVTDEAGTDVETGRALTLLGRSHHGSEQAITSEGLFRAALDKLPPGPVPAVAALRVQALLWYAKLLQDWEKREPAAARLVDDADEVAVTPESAPYGSEAGVQVVSVLPSWGLFD